MDHKINSYAETPDKLFWSYLRLSVLWLRSYSQFTLFAINT